MAGLLAVRRVGAQCAHGTAQGELAAPGAVHVATGGQAGVPGSENDSKVKPTQMGSHFAPHPTPNALGAFNPQTKSQGHRISAPEVTVAVAPSSVTDTVLPVAQGFAPEQSSQNTSKGVRPQPEGFAVSTPKKQVILGAPKSAAEIRFPPLSSRLTKERLQHRAPLIQAAGWFQCSRC